MTSVIDVVSPNKPAHSCEGAFTDKTGGCNSDAGLLWEELMAQAPERVTQVVRE